MPRLYSHVYRPSNYLTFSKATPINIQMKAMIIIFKLTVRRRFK